MIIPFLRLVIIYIVVILAALLVFKRDSVMSLFGMSGVKTETAAAADVPAKIAQPVAAIDAPATPHNSIKIETTSPEHPPKYPTKETARIITPAPTSPQPADDIQARLEQARKAYWTRDIAGAETLYKSLLRDAPNSADIKGELGNLYYTQRRMPEAAQMYHQTGLQLIKDRNTQQIIPLIGVLQSIAPDLANDLRRRLSQ